jgi:hypothetical protein
MKINAWRGRTTGGRGFVLPAMVCGAAALAIAALCLSHGSNRLSPGTAARWTYLQDGQGWTAGAREEFYYTSQGSQMMPYAWFLAVEQAGSRKPFHAGLQRFGFLVPPPSAKNPDGLPLGFVADTNDATFGGVREAKWVGLTCAACHTAAIDYRAHPGDRTLSTLVIDGGPTLANYGAFIAALAPAIDQTERDPAKYARFERAVLGPTPAPDARVRLDRSYARFAAEFDRYAVSSRTAVPWGRGRVDAFGMIFNRVCSIDLDIRQNCYSPNAPVSYPFLWNVDRQDHIQWHGEVENINANPLGTHLDRFGRNAAEVLGVFARIDVTPGAAPGYPSTINLDGLIALEYAVSRLRAPRWPQNILGRIDGAEAREGETIYQARCERCHERITSPFQTVAIRPGRHLIPVDEVGTDANMTANVHSRLSLRTGRLAGQRFGVIFGEPLKETASAQQIVGHAVTGALLRLPFGDLDPRLAQPQGLQRLLSSAGRAGPAAAPVVGYEARPLHGIWATSPYLHNGSVPTLQQLLLPSRARSVQFYVGSREYDTVNVGYRSDPQSGGELFDTRLDGNHNSGHEYGADLSAAQRRRLIEYLKTL